MLDSYPDSAALPAGVPLAPGARRLLVATTRAGGAFAVAVGTLSTFAWTVGAPGIARLGIAEVVPVRPLVGLALIPGGLALEGAARPAAPGQRQLTLALAAAVALIALAGLAEAIPGFTPSFDERIASVSAAGLPPAMPIGVALILGVLAAGLAALALERPAARLTAQWLGLVICCTGLFLALVEVLGLAFDTVPVTISPLSVIALTGLGAGLAAARPGLGPVSVASSGLASARLARRLALTLLVATPLLATALYLVTARGPLDEEAGFAAMAAGTLLLALVGASTFATRMAPAEARLVAAEQRFEALVETSLSAFAALAPDGAIRYANDALGDLLGRDASALSALRFDELLADPREAADFGAWRERRRRRFDARLRHADGSLRQVTASAAPAFDAAGTFDGLLLALTDLTAERAAEEARRAVAERYRTMVETAAEGMVLVAPDGTITFANHQAADLLARDGHALIGRRFHEFAAPDTRRSLEGRPARRAAGEAHIVVDLDMVRPDGTHVLLASSFTALTGPDGRVTGALGVLTDVGRTRRAEQELRASEARLKAIIDQSPAIIEIVDLNLRTVMANRRLQEVTGRSPDELKGLPAGAGAPAHRRERLQDMLRRARDERRVIQEEQEDDLGEAGAPATWLISCFPLHDEHGEPYACAVMAIDVTALKRAEHEVRELNRTLEARVASRTRELEETNGALDTFAFTVAHDLRAPLQTMHGLSQVVLDDPEALPDDTRRRLEFVHRGATELTHLVDDLLAFARSGQDDLDRVPLDTAQIAREALEALAEGEPLVAAQVRIDRALPGCEADRRLLRMVFQNLLSNALKFTRDVPAPQVDVTAEVTDGEVVYAVRDNGIGFDPGERKRIFAMFERLHTTDEHEGTGLGLAIAARIVQRHGGRIWADGAPGAGATFRFTLGPDEDPA